MQEAKEKNGRALPLSQKIVALVFGPENGAVSERLVFDAAKEATAKSYSHLFVIGFKVEPNARLLIEKCADVVGISATYVEATMDLQMGDLLKNMRSSQIFSVCGLPDITLHKAGKSPAGESLQAATNHSKAAIPTLLERGALRLEIRQPSPRP